MNRTVFVKVYVKERLPEKEDIYLTNVGLNSFIFLFEKWWWGHNNNNVEYWLEEIELPSESDVNSFCDFLNDSIDIPFTRGYKKGCKAFSDHILSMIFKTK